MDLDLGLVVVGTAKSSSPKRPSNRPRKAVGGAQGCVEDREDDENGLEWDMAVVDRA